MKETLDKIRTNWDVLKHLIHKEYPNMSDRELLHEPGNENELLDNLKRITGKSDAAIAKYIDDITIDKK